MCLRKQLGPIGKPEKQHAGKEIRHVCKDHRRGELKEKRRSSQEQAESCRRVAILDRTQDVVRNQKGERSENRHDAEHRQVAKADKLTHERQKVGKTRRKLRHGLVIEAIVLAVQDSFCQLDVVRII